ncbi:aryl-sulfate sulfotransferase [Ichthyenterobacterium sp. W332]|uniref:Aryl-sulfate sulfotransferase n=1 Tax=Microcosmobacter mediterraneus TaxID=3075607 RepID=A0ABU2YJP8_9FLAO|nr:aryl-sulfate sulfotransferase [Ichthyenterobacterium sp. W332]MDT0558395.1 aryl-sulfate sulfotransferase [Ichthyenterobacterium sp. W332]
MKKKLLLICCFLVNIPFTTSQNTVGTISITNAVEEGYTLFTNHTEVFLINNCGQVVKQWTSDFPPGNAVYLLENGNILRAGRTSSTDITFGGQGGVIELFDWDGILLWRYFYDTPQHRQHHDVFPMPNGNILILAATVMTDTEAIQAGRDPNSLPDSELYNERIIEVEIVGFNQANIVWEWNINDHLVQDFDNTKDNFGDVSASPEKLDINFLNGGSGGANWLHINSIQYYPNLDQIVLSSRNLSEIWIIDHSTTTAEAATSSGGTYGKGGDLLYRWGNPQSYRQGTEIDRRLYGQHYPHFIDDGLNDAGKIILFNNGNGRNPSFSEAFIINPPTDAPGVYSYTPDTAYGPLSTDYNYLDPINPQDFFSNILSSAQRLPNGNTLICEGANGRLFEIDTNENLVWEYISPVHNISGLILTQEDDPGTIPNNTFRAIKYTPDYPAFLNRDLTPGNVIELNGNLNPCDNLDVNEFEIANISLYPNPVIDQLYLSGSSEVNSYILHDVLGNIVREKMLDAQSINFSSLNSGIYFLRLRSDNSSITKKIIKQ